MILKNNMDIIIYHGGTEVVKEIDLTRSRANIGFGKGFYTTTSIQQARKWANGTARRRKEEKAFINQYLIHDFNGLNTLEFEYADMKWFEYIVGNRKGKQTDDTIDVVVGPVADDDTTIVFQAYMSGLYGVGDNAIKKAIEFLEVGNLKNQICLKSSKAINKVSWTGVDEIWLQRGK